MNIILALFSPNDTALLFFVGLVGLGSLIALERSMNGKW